MDAAQNGAEVSREAEQRYAAPTAAAAAAAAQTEAEQSKYCTTLAAELEFHGGIPG